MRVHSAVFPLAGPWGCDVWDTLPLRALWDWRFFSGPARHQARRGRSLLERARTRWVVESRRRARSRCGTRNAPLLARLAPPPHPCLFTWARPTCSVGGACPGACPDGPGGAGERAGGASFQGFLGLPRWPPPRSRPGARRPRVRVGVRRGKLCGSAGGSAPVRRRVPGVRPARLAVRSPLLAPRGPAGPWQARPEPPGGECGRTQLAGWWDRGRSRAAGLRGSSAVGCLGASSCKEAAGFCPAT